MVADHQKNVEFSFLIKNEISRELLWLLKAESFGCSVYSKYSIWNKKLCFVVKKLV